MSGWQAEEQYLIRQCSIVLERVIDRFPRGTLWRLNSEWESHGQQSHSSLIHRTAWSEAKLYRMQHDTASAIVVIEEALSHGSSFREADSLLVFEVSVFFWFFCFASHSDQ